VSAALLFAADQIAKALVEVSLPVGARSNGWVSWIEIAHTRNAGAAFGLLDRDIGVWPFAGISLLALAAIASFARQLPASDRRTLRFLALILGGTASNLVDRLVRGEVIDYLHVNLWSGYVWPDFNLADVGIVVGVVALIADLLVHEASSRARSSSARRQ
jgi:signal peptidase II